MIFLDTNIILRYLTRDDIGKAERCHELLQKASRGEAQLFTSESVIAEVVYVLSSPRLYHLPPDKAAAMLRPIIAVLALKPAVKQLYLRALGLYATHHIDFEDALSVAHMEQQGITEIMSYDQHFDRVDSVTRREP
jgi:predicted nucleic acid-binding protein